MDPSRRNRLLALALIALLAVPALGPNTALAEEILVTCIVVILIVLHLRSSILIAMRNERSPCMMTGRVGKAAAVVSRAATRSSSAMSSSIAALCR